MMHQKSLQKYSGPLLLLSLVLGIGTIIWLGKKTGLNNVDIALMIMAFLTFLIYIVFIRKRKIKKLDLTDPSLQFPKTMPNGIKAKAVIRNFTAGAEIYENGTLIARLFHIHIQVEGYHGDHWNTLIKAIIPLAHTDSIKKDTAFFVLYNQTNQYEAVIATGQKDWHFLHPDSFL